MKKIPLHQHWLLKENDAPDLAGKTISRAEMIGQDKTIRIYFTDDSLLSITNFVEKVDDPELVNFAQFKITPSYCANVNHSESKWNPSENPDKSRELTIDDLIEKSRSLHR